jgi:hypothetical protein
MQSLVRVFRRSGFTVHGMFIFGYPMPPGVEFSMPLRERVQRFKNFIRRAKIDTAQVLLPVPLPGTALRRRLRTKIGSTDPRCLDTTTVLPYSSPMT